MLYLPGALDLDREDIGAVYLGDDITGEHAVRTVKGTGIGVFVGDSDDPEVRWSPDRGRLRPDVEYGGLAISAHRRTMSASAPHGRIMVKDFSLAYDGFVPDEEGLREALTSAGNGYFRTRGAAGGRARTAGTAGAGQWQ